MSTQSEDGGARIGDSDHAVSRRDMLKHGATAVAGSAALLGGGTAFAQAPAVATGTQAGRKFRAYLTPPVTGELRGVETITLRNIQSHQVLIRTQAAQACYTIVNLLQPTPAPVVPAAGAPPPPAGPRPAAIGGHGGVGIVEAVGDGVRRVQVGDRVIVPVTANCGQCYNCVRGRGDFCTAAAGRPVVAVADMANGTPVNGNLGGFAELMVAWEEQTVPVDVAASSEELSLLSCVMATGLGLATKRIPVEAGSDVLVLGAGPLGLSAVQGARIQGAAQIIVVEPVPYRRDLAMKLGATTVLDPNAYSLADLTTKIRQLCTPKLNRSYAGARGPNPNAYGPGFILEAVGGDRFPPKVPTGPDPTGVQSLQLAWNICPTGGIIRTCGVGQGPMATITFPAGQWANAGKTHLPGNFAGVNTFRDLPIFSKMIDSKQFDAKALVGQTFPLEKAKEALQTAADRTSISGIVTFPT
jgi:S-(hydroxymethyl)glutathione dehydrogenase / alcohol dehydrogenase